MIGRRGPPSQSWRTFLRNHADAIAAIAPHNGSSDLCRGSNPDLRAAVCLSCCGPWTAATAVVCGDPQSVGGVAGSTDGRGISRGTRRPPIWCATMIVPTGRAFQRRIRAMGIRDRPISPKSPWQNPYAERLIGTLRRECLDHVLIVGERHLRRMLASYSSYYNESRTHLALEKDARCGELSRGAE